MRRNSKPDEVGLTVSRAAATSQTCSLLVNLHLLMKTHQKPIQNNPQKLWKKQMYKSFCLKIMQEKGINHPP
jgi:hypothetical protein